MTSADRRLIAELKAEVIGLRDDLEIAKELAEIKVVLVEIKDELGQAPKLEALADRVHGANSRLANVVKQNS